jgi:hypothetical protein
MANAAGDSCPQFRNQIVLFGGSGLINGTSFSSISPLLESTQQLWPVEWNW